MSDILDGLLSAERLASQIAGHPALNDQQRLFLHHIARTCQRMIGIVEPVPHGELAETMILARIAPELIEPMAVVYGYSRLLLDSPDAFGGASLPAAHITTAEHLFSLGWALAQALEALPDSARLARLQARQTPPAPWDISTMLHETLPIWLYELRHTQAHIHTTIPHTPLMAWTQIYHLRELVGHIILTIARELDNHAHIKLTAGQAQGRILLMIASEGIAFNQQDLYTLFQHQGRDLLRQQTTHCAADISLTTDPQTITWLVISLMPPSFNQN